MEYKRTVAVIAFGFAGVLLLSVNLFGVSFTRVTTGPVVSDSGYSRSVNFVDYDNDGYPDIYVGNGASNAGVNAINFLYHNNRDGTFTQVLNDTIVTILASSDGTAWGDYDGDGFPDLFIATWRGQQNLLFHNEHGTGFTRVTGLSPTLPATWSDFAAWADYDNDGYLDLIVTVGFSSPLGNLLYHNNGDGTFTQVTSGPVVTDAVTGHGVAWGDYDNDGRLDLFVCNVGSPNALYHNLGGGQFEKITTGAIATDIGPSIRACWGDYDNDGYLDLFVANTNGHMNFVYHNNGDGTFTKITTGPVVTNGGWSDAGAFADLDNDGNLDLFVTSGFHTTQDHNFLFMGKGDGTFVQDTSGPIATDTGWSVGFSFGDIDRDGDLDLVVAKCLNQNEDNALYVNQGNSNHWINIQPIGSLGNHFGIGTRIRLKATIGGIPKWQIRETTSLTGAGQNGPLAHFGLGDATTIDSLVLQFPSGKKRILTNVAVDQYLDVPECPTPQACCCQGRTGNVNGAGGVDLGDLSALVSYLTSGGFVLPCPNSANVNGTGAVDLGDLSALVSYLTGGGFVLPNCP